MMFGELIENAIKFSYNNKPIEISSIDEEGAYTLAVRNYGKGLTKEEIRNLDVFTLQDRRRNEQQHGNGLGLILVSRLATFYDAKFNIASIPDCYTEVSLQFRKYNSI
jgi:signal transduction histidine kinase